jgi:hypothetical protein
MPAPEQLTHKNPGQKIPLLPGAEHIGATSPVHPLDEDVDDTATRQANPERFVV